jgi:hypothetical protein
MPHWTTTARKTEEKMAGDRNRALGLILDGKMMMMMMMMIKSTLVALLIN